MATNDPLDQIFSQFSNLTISVTAIASNTSALMTENENGMKEIKKIAKGLGYFAESENDQERIMTDDDAIFQAEIEKKR